MQATSIGGHYAGRGSSDVFAIPDIVVHNLAPRQRHERQQHEGGQHKQAARDAEGVVEAELVNQHAAQRCRARPRE